MGSKHVKPVGSSRRQAAAKGNWMVRNPPTDIVASRSASGPASKVSVTIDAAVLRQARVAAKRSGKTLSAHISQALERDLRRQRMAELVAGFEAEHGVISPEEVAKAIASWQG